MGDVLAVALSPQVREPLVLGITPVIDSTTIIPHCFGILLTGAHVKIVFIIFARLLQMFPNVDTHSYVPHQRRHLKPKIKLNRLS